MVVPRSIQRNLLWPTHFNHVPFQSGYGRRNTIESRNAMLKNGSYQGAGDVTTRLMRGWAAQMLCMAMAAVG